MSNEWAPPESIPDKSGGAEGRAKEALALMQDALRLLDENDGPDDAGAHLDCAINRIREWIEGETEAADKQSSK